MYFSNQSNKAGFRIAALVMMLSLLIFTFTGCLEDGETKDTTSSDSQKSVVLDFYSALQDNENFPYTLTEKAKEMLKQNESLFLDNSIDGCEENTDYTIEYKALDKNIDKYGDKLLYLSEAMVIQIEEAAVDEETTVTDMLICDAEENYYDIISLCGYDDIYKGDVISIYGLPLAKSGFENISGGTTLVVVVAASHIEKIPE